MRLLKTLIFSISLLWIAFAVQAQNEDYYIRQMMQQGSYPLKVGARILQDDFDSLEESTWEILIEDWGAFHIQEGAYHARMENNSGIVAWALSNADLYDNIVIQTRTHQYSLDMNNGYGLVCRVTDEHEGDGYYFRISADGYYSIFKNKGTNYIPLVNWTYSDLIRQGPSENTLTAVCIDDYLAFYVNGRLLAESYDDDYSAGFVGFTTVAYSQQAIDIEFDEVTLWAAYPFEGPRLINSNDARSNVQESLKQGLLPLELEDELLVEDFAALSSKWEYYRDPHGKEINLYHEMYQIQLNDSSGSYLAGYYDDWFDDIVIHVQTEQLSTDPNNGYGVICRGDDPFKPSAYLFAISGDGFYTIQLATDENISPLIDWKMSPVIQKGQAVNALTVVCFDQYLAFYVNDELLAEYIDKTYSQGRIALMAMAFENQSVRILFDNLRVWSVKTP